MQYNQKSSFLALNNHEIILLVLIISLALIWTIYSEHSVYTLYFIVLCILAFFILKHPFVGLISYVAIGPLVSQIIRIGGQEEIGILTWSKIALLFTFLSVSIRIVFLKKRHNFFGLRDPILMLLILYALTSGISLQKSIALDITAYLSQCVVPIFIYALAKSILRSNYQVEKFLKFLIICTFINAVFIIIESIGFFNFFELIGIYSQRPTYSDASFRAEGLFGNPNLAGVYITLILPFVMYLFFRKKEYHYVVLFLLFVLCIFLTLSRKAIAGSLSIILIFFVVDKHRKYLPLAILLVLLITYFMYNVNILNLSLMLRARIPTTEGHIISRYDIISAGYKLFLENPIWGSGYGNAGFLHQPYRRFISDLGREIGLHNQYVTILAEGGLVAFIPFLLLLIVPLLKAFRLLRSKNINRGFINAFIAMIMVLYIMLLGGSFLRYDHFLSLFVVLVLIIMRGNTLLRSDNHRV